MANKVDKPVKALSINTDRHGDVVLRINEGEFVLDDNEQSRLLLCLNRALDPGAGLFPFMGYSTFIVYENGVLAASLNVSKLDKEGNNYLFVVTYNLPGQTGYDTDLFFVNNKTIEAFVKNLGNDIVNRGI